MIRYLLTGVSISALLCAAAPEQALGQEDETILETIVVTSTKRDQDILDVPGTVDTASEKELRKKGVSSLGQLDKVFADTSIKQRSSRAYTNVTIRGQSSVDFYNPSVQVYVDGLPQDAATYGQPLPGGLESVELLYGPQGTLYGRGAIGGVINVITRKPDNEFRVDGYTALHTLGADASLLVNTPVIANTLYADAAVTFRKEDDEYEVMGTNDEIGGTEDWNGRFRLRYAPEGSPLDIMVTAARSEVDSTEEQFVMESMFKDRIALPVPSKYDLDTTSLGINASYDLGFAKITALTGYQDRTLDRTIFGSYTPETQETFSQELRIASNPDEGNAVDYVIGVYGQYLDFERRMPAANQVSRQKIESLAAFADLTWHVTDRIDLSPGARFDYEKAKAIAEGGISLDDDDDFTAVSPKLAASFALAEEWRIYALYSTGFKAGGFTRNVTPANIAFTYDPQNTNNGEAGIKYQSADGSLSASLAAYYNVTDDYQMFVGIQPVQYLQNVGEVTAKGIDLKVKARPTERLGIMGGLGLNKTTFTDYKNPVTPGLDLTGNRVPYAPEVTANFSVDYAFDLPDERGQLIPRAGVSYASEIYFDETNGIGQEGFALVDLGMAWQVNDHVAADVFVNNLFDKTYAVYGFTAPGYGNLYQLGHGRAIGASLNITF